MTDQAGPTTAPAVAVDAAQQQPVGSSHSYSEAMLWAQVSADDAFDASDACSGTSTFQLLPELSSSNSCSRSTEPHNDLLSSWIANYMATSQPESSTVPAAVAEPAFMDNADLEVPSELPDWNTSSFDVTKSPPPPQQKWMPVMPLQAQGPDLPLTLGLQQQHSPAAEHFTRSSWRAETSISPSPEYWNNSVALGQQLPVQRGVYQTGPARRELFLPHSAAASTHMNQVCNQSRNLINVMQGTANAFGDMAAPHHAPVSFLTPGNYANFNAPMPRPSWLTPIGSCITNDFPVSYNNTRFGQEMMLPQTSSERPYSSELSRLLPAAAIATAPPPLLTSIGNMPSWFPRAHSPMLPSQTGISHPGFQSLSGPGESSTPSRKRSNFAGPGFGLDHFRSFLVQPSLYMKLSEVSQRMRTVDFPQIEDHSGVQWAPSLAPSRAEWGSGPSTVASREVMALGPALNTNGKPRASRGSATDPQSVYARFRREKITERMKTLQGLVPNGKNVDIVTMLDEAHDYIKFLEHQIELLKSDENWKSATPSIYKGVDLSKPQPPKPSPDTYQSCV